MGKNNKIAHPMLLNSKQTKAAKRYGIDPWDYGFSRNNGGIQKKSPMDFSKDVAKAARNDYDTRRTIEAAAMAGNGKAEKFAKKGLNSLEDVTKANNMFSKMHGRAGNGGDFSSTKDFAGLTFGQVKRDRDKLKNVMSAGEQQQAAASTPNAEPVELSTELQDARDTVQAFDNKDYEVYNGAQSSDGDGQREQAAQSFLDNFKLDLKSKMRPTFPF